MLIQLEVTSIHRIHRWRNLVKGMIIPCVWIMGTITSLPSCESGNRNITQEKDIVSDPEKLDDHIARNIISLMDYLNDHKGRLDEDSLAMDSVMKSVYDREGHSPLWSTEGHFVPMSDSLIQLIDSCLYWGLIPTDFNRSSIKDIAGTLRSDSTARQNAMLWARADLLLTNAAFLLGRQLKQGRLPKDSITLNKDSVLAPDFYEKLIGRLRTQGSFRSVYEELEPRYKGYDSLKIALRSFLDSVKVLRPYTPVFFPGRDSARLGQKIVQRLYELNYIDTPDLAMDSMIWKKALKAYQRANGLKETGTANVATVRMLNKTPLHQFLTIAINLDRYKQLPDTLPARHIWVNLPSYYMEVRDADTLVFRSRIVVGKPETRTPLLSSKITNMVTYPQWNIPNSIIEKEVLPGVKKNKNYFAKHDYVVVNTKGEEVDPLTVNWKKYKKTIPYKVIQGSGDDNALGILKFNFFNKFSVYMHDTNQRYLFQNSSRSLSHGCVRVQEWQKLAYYLLRYDSAASLRPIKGNYAPADSLRAWMDRKEKHVLPIQNRMPVYFRYFTAEWKQGKLKIYDDVYGYDDEVMATYFASSLSSSF